MSLPLLDLARLHIHVSQASLSLVLTVALTNILLRGFPWQGDLGRSRSVSKVNRGVLQGRTDGSGEHETSLKLNDFVTPKTFCCLMGLCSLDISVLTDVSLVLHDLYLF